MFKFGEFSLDAADRQLRRRGEPVELNARYLDALALLVIEAGRLVSKDRFLDEVWRGVPVTDEALTQCIRTLRRLLGDDAVRPRFIETVPKHGYRFIAAVADENDRTPVASRSDAWQRRWRLTLAGTLGGGAAGLVGGVLYGFAAAAQPAAGGVGAASMVLVVVIVTVLMAVVGAAGVSAGIAALRSASGRPWAQSIAGGALGGLVVGAVVSLVGLDAFNLLLGRAPKGITGPFEGVLLGAAVGAGAWLAFRVEVSIRRAVAVAAGIGGAAGLLINLLGGRMMAGSLDLLAREFPSSRLRLDGIGGLLGEASFGPISRAVTGTLEGALFGGCIVATMVIATRRTGADS